MPRPRPSLAALALAFCAAPAAAQTMFKCVDDRRQVTYSNLACDKQGLKDAGPVSDRTTTMPMGPLPKPAAKGAAKDGDGNLPSVQLKPPAQEPATPTAPATPAGSKAPASK